MLDCNIVVISSNSSCTFMFNFELIPLGKVLTPLSFLLMFYKDGFGIKLPTKVDMPLNKETKPYMKFHQKVSKLNFEF